MTKFYNTDSGAPFSATRALHSLATAVELHLTARDQYAKLQAWRYLEAKLAEAQELLKFVA